MFDKSSARQLVGLELRTSNGEKVGKIGGLYIDDYNDQPEWVTVNTGLFGTKESFVPLVQAERHENTVVVPYAKDQIKKAPGVSEGEHLSEPDEQALYEHYGIPYVTEGSTFADTERLGVAGAGRGGTTRAGVDQDAGTDSTEGGGRHAVRSSAGDATGGDAMTRSEQRLDVGTERVETGRARLHKWVEEENVQVEVPVTREKARLVTEPVTDANRDDALSGPDLTESEHEVTLTEERPVVSRETVPVERVRLETDTDTDVRHIEETVGKERIDVDGDVDSSAGGDRRR
jgi:uncharacterized protein (TIGR02271 family)